MMQVVLHHFPGAIATYKFQCRAPNIDLRPFADEIKEEIESFCQLRLQQSELDYLRSLDYIKDDFVDLLRIFQLNSEFVTISTNETFELLIHGPWLHTILFEVPILAIISEVYFRNTHPEPDYQEGRRRLQEKMNGLLNQQTEITGFRFSDFGTRRRFSRDWHSEVVKSLHNGLPEYFTGTSNVYLAKQWNSKPIGTMAHEYIQACQSLGPRLSLSQRFAFETWAKEYRGDLGIALSDTYGTDAFLRDFDLYFSKLFDGARQDSGDPILWGEKVIQHYRDHRIDPKTKTLVFSDSLTFPLALTIYQHFKDHSNPVFGIGTNLTNDIGVAPLDIVIKMYECNGQPVAKISEAPGKVTCDNASYLEYLKQVFDLN